MPSKCWNGVTDAPENTNRTDRRNRFMIDDFGKKEAEFLLDRPAQFIL